jgi:hypothetical protein
MKMQRKNYIQTKLKPDTSANAPSGGGTGRDGPLGAAQKTGLILK